MTANKCFKCKLVLLGVSGVLFLAFFIVSLAIDYQLELSKEHIRFRKGFISQMNWKESPFGSISMYLFNVTNAEEFLNGNDTRMRVQEVGPIVYKMRGQNKILNQTDDMLIYHKTRYKHIEFDPEASCAPDILNQTITLPNLVLLGAAAKLHDWVFLVRHAFNAITINEPLFMNRSVYYFLWDFKVPALNLLSQYVPNIVSNCGLLFNALREKTEIYNVRIGTKNGFDNFFRINQLNGQEYFAEQKSNIGRNKPNETCPINVVNALDNSLFPPYIKKNTNFTIVAIETCRTMEMYYDGIQEHNGYKGYRYVIEDRNTQPSCLDNSRGIKLHKGMWDVSKCVINDAPSVFSAPHFLHTSYNYSEHYEGMSPNVEKHKAHIILEPTTGVPLAERYRFMSSIPMPDMKGYNKNLQKFHNVVVPNFWYEFLLGDLPPLIEIPIKINAQLITIIQPVLTVIFFLIAIVSFLKLYLLVKQQTFLEFYGLLREAFQRKKIGE
ncbi:scavenger receptor class B member 1 [Stomoxys calcitrans]|uniref:Scavenger receptor class B member 1-like n=1 Tax=Stomoxys calcitrans TaxID=35570 RepID=A0A1I8NSD3_STOCA|nr:scavenger receptor class B member 1 [Stomoxys calcitrans]